MISVLFGFIEAFLRYIPTGLGRKLRYSYYKHRLGSCGKNVIIDMGVIFENVKSIYIRDNVWIDHNTILIAGKPPSASPIFYKENKAFTHEYGEIHINSGVHIAPFVVVQGHGGVSIGEYTTLAAGSKVYSLSHHYKNLNDRTDSNKYYFSSMAPCEKQYLIASPVVIEEGCALGLNSILLPGTHIAEGSWIGVGTYVKGTAVEPDSIYTASPARFSKYRDQ